MEEKYPVTRKMISDILDKGDMEAYKKIIKTRKEIERKVERELMEEEKRMKDLQDFLGQLYKNAIMRSREKRAEKEFLREEKEFWKRVAERHFRNLNLKQRFQDKMKVSR